MTPLSVAGSEGAPPPEELASRIAARLCHDLIGPANAVVWSLDLLAESGDRQTRDEALAAAAAAARRLIGLLAFSRTAFGVGEGVFDTAMLESLARGAFADLRPRLEWAVETPALTATAGRILLNLVQIAAGAVATGGVVRARGGRESGRTVVAVDARGPRAELSPEVLAGLAGEPLGKGLGPRWAQARYVQAVARAARGEVVARSTEDGLLFEAVLPT